ncbi:MAG: hypothetical protein DCF32_09070 [Leptolyngbya sp.]|nr:MAG: hypothetical protein DCF32_09070 [Leptolyngbya sp.]
MGGAVPHALTLNRVKLSLAEGATPIQRQAQQRQVTQALEQMSLHPILPPQAILVVRHFADPSPGRLLADHHWRGLRDWEQAAQAALNDCWQSAHRPARSPVPAQANSVWFADQAEWLACLSRDIYRGVARDRWWWQTTLRPHTHRSKLETLVQLWREDAQWLPPTLDLLLRHDQATLASLLTELSPDQTQQLLAQVAQVYQCPLPSPAAPQQAIPFLIAALEPHLPLAVRRVNQPLAPETQALIAFCFTLPHTAQLLDRALATLSTLETASAIEDPPDVQSADPPDFSAEPSHPSTWLLTTELDANEASTIDSSGPLAPDLNLAAEQGIATAVGGLWYLVNVLVALDWPGRTTTLTPWHQLPALAQALLPDVPLDPVWGLLAEIAGDPIPQSDLVQWQETTLAQVRPYLAARLEQPEAIADYLLEPATLYLTRTHVDVVFALDQIRLDVRMAGLDQDPGWVPELARAIAFHYE